MEKKIDLPETWIKGFNQVSSSASLGGMVSWVESVNAERYSSIIEDGMNLINNEL